MNESTKAEIRRLHLKNVQLMTQSATWRGQSLMAYASGEMDKAEEFGQMAEKALKQAFEAYDAFEAYLNKL